MIKSYFKCIFLVITYILFSTIIVEPNAPKDFRLATVSDNRTQTFEWELDPDGYQQSLIFSKCFKRNASDCENVTIANSSVLPAFSPSSPANKMNYSSSISEIGEYLISLLAQSGNFTAQSTILYFKLGNITFNFIIMLHLYMHSCSH